MRIVFLWLLMLWPVSGLAQERDELAAHYPDPAQVKADIAAAAGDVRAEEVAGRQAGRLLMLANTIVYTYSSSGNTSALPAAQQRRHDGYVDAYKAIEGTMRATPGWADCGYFANLLGTCLRQNFNYARNEYEHGRHTAEETAALYFPEAMRPRFVQLADFHGLDARRRDVQAENDRQRFINLFSWACLLAGALNIGLALRRFFRLRKYEFENTTDGGAVRFSSFGAVLGHGARSGLSALQLLAGLLLVGLGVAVRAFI